METTTNTPTQLESRPHASKFLRLCLCRLQLWPVGRPEGRKKGTVLGRSPVFSRHPWEFPVPRVPHPERPLELPAKVMKPTCLCPKVSLSLLPHAPSRWWTLQRGSWILRDSPPAQQPPEALGPRKSSRNQDATASLFFPWFGVCRRIFRKPGKPGKQEWGL